VLVALSLATDLGSGFPLEKGLRTCLVAVAFGERLALERRALADVYHAALLRAVGCTAVAPENAAAFDDDLAFERAMHGLDLADSDALRRFGAWAGPRRAPALAARFARAAFVKGPRMVRAGCEVATALGERLSLPAGALAALQDVYERWDGRGLPGERGGELLSLAARVVAVAEQAVIAHADGGAAAARSVIAARRGGQLDPELCERFAVACEELLATLDAEDLVAAVIAAEPAPSARVPAGQLGRLAIALAAFADLKSLYTLGHSTGVAALAQRAARLAGFDEDAAEHVRLCALVHDLGRVSVSTGIWDRPGRLGVAEHERIRLHPHWSERVLARSPALAPLATTAGAHHERLDGSGYHRGSAATSLDGASRILAAADVLHALTEPRAHRPARSLAAAARELQAEATAGRLCHQASAAVLAAAGLRPARSEWPDGLTDREVDVLRLTARGLTNKQIAAELVISARTVQHHLARIYDKTGRRTRAGAAVYAIEHALVPAATGR
jgi:HD-GYP domain-containing protein (c-di-GMP phosphodiesterase class II)